MPLLFACNSHVYSMQFNVKDETLKRPFSHAVAHRLNKKACFPFPYEIGFNCMKNLHSYAKVVKMGNRSIIIFCQPKTSSK